MLTAQKVREFQTVARMSGTFGDGEPAIILQRADSVIRTAMTFADRTYAVVECPASMHHDIAYILSLRGFHVTFRNPEAGLRVSW